MATHFSFSFSGDDIEEDKHTAPAQGYVVANPEPSSTAGPASAFPVQGKALLPPVHHDLDQMLSRLPSKIAYGMMDVDLDGKGTIRLPRRELWDVRVQLMAEEGGEGGEGGDSEHEPGLGQHDVKTGIYEGGFKSWESSVDLVKTLASEGFSDSPGLGPCRLIEVWFPCHTRHNPSQLTHSSVGLRHGLAISCFAPVGLCHKSAGAENRLDANPRGLQSLCPLSCDVA